MAHIRRDTDKQSGNTWQGDNLTGDKDNHTIRIMFHNVNGLPLTGIDGMDMFANEQANLQVDIQGFSEHCLDTTKYHVHQTARDLLRRYYTGQASLQIDSSKETAINTYKPGGTGILLLGDLVGQQEPQGRGGDAMGRWSYIHLRRKAQPPITIISAYQVCPRPTNIIGNTAYHQQIRALNKAGRHQIHPRHAFITDLINFVAKLQTNGHDIILGGDFNESIEDKNSGLLKLITTTNLTDPFQHRFPHHPTFGTHAMGHRRIDSVLFSPSLLPSLKSIGYAPFQYTKSSDHRPLLFDLDRQILENSKAE